MTKYALVLRGVWEDDGQGDVYSVGREILIEASQIEKTTAWKRGDEVLGYYYKADQVEKALQSIVEQTEREIKRIKEFNK